MQSESVGRALVVVVVSMCVVDARATSLMQAEIPNVPNACNTCHSDGGGSTLNAFGLDVWVTRDRAIGAPVVVRWSQIWNVDSDGDGQTNGMELGDPCGVWAAGDVAPRVDDVSEPSDESSSSSNPISGCPDGESPPDEADPRPEQPSVLDITQTNNTNPLSLATGGCFGHQLAPTSWTSDFALLALLALLVRARRRR